MDKLWSKFPTTEIIISSLLPRKETNLHHVIQYFNDFLYGVCYWHPLLSFMRNTNIVRHMLVDNPTDTKHIKYEAFLILLSNIRNTLFGKIPYIRRSR